MRKLFLFLLGLMALQEVFAQKLEKMQWFTDPEKWEVKNNTLQMFVTPQSDYWRISHYGFTVDDAPFYNGSTPKIMEIIFLQNGIR